MKNRIVQLKRKTKETVIEIKLNIDGKGKSKIVTGIGLLDHLLELFSFHGFFDLMLTAKGDLRVDIHHTNEDIGIVLGEAFKKALGKKIGIRRFGYAFVPMEEVLAQVVVDISGRGHFKIEPSNLDLNQEGYSFKDFCHFLEAFAYHLGMNLNIHIKNPSLDLHTTLEPIFKALAIALDQAVKIDTRRKGVPSTKGIID